MRGVQTLFNNLLFDQQPLKPVKTNKGRGDAYIANRDQRMMYRHYYHAKVLRKNYPDVMQALSLEFDLSEPRIVVVLNAKHSMLKDIYKTQPTVKDMKLKYSWMDWSIN